METILFIMVVVLGFVVFNLIVGNKEPTEEQKQKQLKDVAEKEFNRVMFYTYKDYILSQFGQNKYISKDYLDSKLKADFPSYKSSQNNFDLLSYDLSRARLIMSALQSGKVELGHAFRNVEWNYRNFVQFINNNDFEYINSSSNFYGHGSRSGENHAEIAVGHPFQSVGKQFRFGIYNGYHIKWDGLNLNSEVDENSFYQLWIENDEVVRITPILADKKIIEYRKEYEEFLQYFKVQYKRKNDKQTFFSSDFYMRDTNRTNLG